MEKKNLYRGYGALLALAMTILAMCKGNNSNIPYLNRLLLSMKIPVWSQGTSGLHYTGVAIIIIFFVVCFWVRVYGRYVHPFIKKHTLLTILIICILVPKINTGIIKTYKSFSEGIESIYLYKDDCYVSYSTKEKGEIQVTMSFGAKNLGKKEIECTIWLLPLSDLIHEKVLMGNIKILPHETEYRNFNIVIHQEGRNGNGQFSHFAFAIESDEEYKIINLHDKVLIE